MNSEFLTAFVPPVISKTDFLNAFTQELSRTIVALISIP